MKFESVLGRRAVATEGTAFVTLETTSGNFKMGSLVSDKLGITDGDALAVEISGGEYYIGKGRNGVAVLDADGKETVDDRGRVVYEEDAKPYGATVRNINESGAYQRFAASAAWAALGGSPDVKKVFELGEGVDAQLDTPEGTLSTTMYPLVFVKDEEKIVRTKKEAVATDETNDEVQEAVQDEFAAPGDFNDEEL